LYQSQTLHFVPNRAFINVYVDACESRGQGEKKDHHRIQEFGPAFHFSLSISRGNG
jgi:hypothetical protein